MTGKARLLKLGAALALLALGVYAGKWYWDKLKPVPLYPTQLSFETSREIQQALSKEGIWFQARDLALLVRQGERLEIQGFLAKKGIPRLKNLKLDDSHRHTPAPRKPSLEEQQGVRVRKRLLTIFSFDDASVRIVRPQETYFQDNDNLHHRAEIKVQLAPGATLSPETLQAIVGVVTMEAPQVKAEHVEISELRGKLLYPLEEAGEEPTPKV